MSFSLERSASIKMDEDSYKQFRLRWSDLKYSVAMPWSQSRNSNALYTVTNNKKAILDSIDGCAESGQMTAIMGPSGSGKTTLLECLADRRVRCRSGRVTIDGPYRYAKIAYVGQTDTLFDELTVRESITYASKMYNAKKRVRQGHRPSFDAVLSAINGDTLDQIGQVDSHVLIANHVIKKLGLENCATSRIADISGGERKRTSIAVTLVTKPRVLMLDEPTSGLDSYASIKLFAILRKLVSQKPPIAIILSIHQPSVKLINMVDKVYMLSVIGKAVYEGSPLDIESQLNAIGLDVPHDQSCVEMLSEVAAGEHGPAKVQRLVEAVDLRHQDPLYLLVKPGMFRTCIEIAALPHPPSCWKNFRTLLTRHVLLAYRQKALFWTRLMAPLVIATMASYLFGKIGR